MTVNRLTFDSPYGCRWCGIDRRRHGRRWAVILGVHAWLEPGQAMVLERMRRRRAVRLASEPTKYHAITAWAADATGESGEPYCADCKTDGCRQWIRIDTRLSNRRMELDGINPKRRSKKRGGGWGGDHPWPF